MNLNTKQIYYENYQNQNKNNNEHQNIEISSTLKKSKQPTTNELSTLGPSFTRNSNKNEIDADNKAHLQLQQQHMNLQNGDLKQTQAIETLKQWCFSSQMTQPELTVSFKKLVGIVKSTPADETTEAAVMSERICQGALVQKSSQSGETIANNGADAKAHDLIKDVYMDALIACESRECMQQLLKIIQSQKVDTIRASYYMTRMAVAEKDTIKDESEIKQWVESFVKSADRLESEAIERQKLFATTSIIGKYMKNKCNRNEQIVGELKQSAEQVVKTIIERYIRPVSQSEVQQYQQQTPQQQQQQKELVKKIAKRNAALKALANIPGCVLNEIQEVEQVCLELAQNKQELVTVRQSAIECLQHNDKVFRQLKQITFDQEEPIEVRVAAFRTLMTVVWAGKDQSEQTKQQMATEIVDQVVKHCEEQRNQEQDDQFVLYAISYLDNLRTSQKPEQQAIKECISKNKQHYMQIQLLCKKFKQQLNDIRKSSRNYKLEQEFNQLESGLVIDGDLIYESKQNNQKQYNTQAILPKLVRVNMSMPIMGETVNVVEITLRQNQMDEELLSTLRLVKDAKFNSESVSKVVDSFKSSTEQYNNKRNNNNNKQQQNAEADLTIKVDGCTVVYVCVDDFKTPTTTYGQQQRNTRSVTSLVEEIFEQLKRNPINFNRGFNFNFNERLAKALDVDANIIAGLRFESRANGQLNKDVEIVAKVEPRFAFEAIVGPAKMTSKKLLQRVSTKTAFGVRLHYKNNELVDVMIDLPMNTMELFTFETQMVEKNNRSPYSYTYMPESIYGQEDIYTPEEQFATGSNRYLDDVDDVNASFRSIRKMKRSIFENKKSTFGSTKYGLSKFISGKQQRTIAYELETPEKVARMTGLRGKLRFVASPKDMSFLVQAVCQKYEPQMQGYRFQLQKQQRGVEQQQLILTVSTPGSRFDRTMQWRSIVQSNSQRTLIKTDIQSPLMKSTMQLELIHDGRQYAIKAECVQGQNKWRHNFECGVQRGSQSQSGRIATTYKPYLNIESTFLRRPIQMQGVVSYQQQPKTVISWELKCPTSSDYIQGKFILDQASTKYTNNKQTLGYSRRSMRSPIDLIFERDLTITGEIIAQVAQHAMKVHQMFEYDSNKYSLNANVDVSHKDLKRSIEDQFLYQLKLNKEQQLITVQRKCPQHPRKEYRLTIASDYKIPQQHQLIAEYRYNGKRSSDSIVAYKHKVDVNEFSTRKVQFNYQVELLASEYKLDEKIQGRTEAIFERRQKSIHTEMTSRNKQCKIDVDFESLEKHHIELFLQAQEYGLVHKTSIRADQRQFTCQSRTDKRGELLAKLLVEVMNKQQGDCQIIVEIPKKNIRCVADLKLASGRVSSWAVQTPRFTSKAEFSFDMLNNYNRRSFFKQPFQSLKFKTDLKDSYNHDSYWMDTTFANDKESYFRFNSPIYRTDITVDPRDYTSKFGLFARSKRSINSYPLYSNEDSILNQIFDYAHLKNNKLNLGDKLWMVRSIISPSSSMSDLKQKILRALFEYADRRQQHKHQINWMPEEERFQFNFEHEPNMEYNGQDMFTTSPFRFNGDLNTKSIFGSTKNQWRQQQQSPLSKLSMESELLDFDFDLKPYDGEDSFARLSASTRHPRSAFKKHDSEYKYNKKHGYKASMKHVDREDKHHSWELEADKSPKKWAKMSMDSDKYGKGHYEHNWRKYVNKRSYDDEDKKYKFDEENKYDSEKQYDDQDDVYTNRVKFFLDSPRKHYSHKTDLKWDEPIKFDRFYKQQDRYRRDTLEQQVLSDVQRRYNTFDYLKHINARLSSQLTKNNADLYKLDFDYKPLSHGARLNLDMPNDMLHSSSFEYQPNERLYKLQSKLMDKRNKQATYELLASTKPVIVSGLATAEQEPVFFNDQHPMLEQNPIYYNSLASKLFKQPLKLDYSDKYGRIARVDYDLAPIVSNNLVNEKFYGLRQKRAAVYLKDELNDFEHDSTYDFYPEPLLAGGFKKQHLMKHMQSTMGDYVTKVSTKYGPIVMRLDSNGKTVECIVESPVVNVKLTGESSNMKRNGVKLFKIDLDNKHQNVQLAKIIRRTPIVGEIKPLVDFARKFDETRFEHQTELLISFVDAIFKLKSSTYNKGRLLMVVDGELNKQAEKLIVKINGERTNGQLVCDLVTGSTQLVLDVDDKRTIHHETRLVRLNEKFYTIESMTSYKQQPLFKLNGKVSSMIFEEPMTYFTTFVNPRAARYQSADEHISTFEATIYEPKVYHVRGQFDCVRKEINLVFKNEEEKKIQTTFIKYDAPTKTINVDARLSSPYGGQIYSCQSKIALPGVYYPTRYCRQHQQSCQSEIIYSDKTGHYFAKYLPGEYALINTPYGKQQINLVY